MNAPIERVSRETANRQTAIGEVLSVRVFDLAELPAKVTLAFGFVPGDRCLFLTTSRDHASELQRLGHVVLTPVEYEALALALADGRCTREDALQELRRKLSNARHRLTLDGLAGGVAHIDEHIGRRWTVGALARALGAELVDVRWEEDHG